MNPRLDVGHRLENTRDALTHFVESGTDVGTNDEFDAFDIELDKRDSQMFII